MRKINQFIPLFFTLLSLIGCSKDIEHSLEGKWQLNEVVRNGAVYFCAIGGAGALASKCIASCEVIAFEDLGCESVKKLEFNSFPLTVAIDAHGGNLFIK